MGEVYLTISEELDNLRQGSQGGTSVTHETDTTVKVSRRTHDLIPYALAIEVVCQRALLMHGNNWLKSIAEILD